MVTFLFSEVVRLFRTCIFVFVFVFAFAFSLLAQTSSASSNPSVQSHSPISQNELKTSVDEIDQLLKAGSWLEAKSRYRSLIQYDLPEADRKSLQKALEDLNIKILFSLTPTPDSFFYTVQRGDALFKLAKKYNTTVELIKKSNHLENDSIRTGMKLKISKAVYSILVDTSEITLQLFSDKELLKTYPVATGREGHPTPVGSFTIVNKLINPTWYKAGAVVAPDSPINILGTRWLGFSLPGYGIHGTTLPETIGTAASEGCVRMFNKDVEELYAIVPTNTTVIIVDHR